MTVQSLVAGVVVLAVPVVAWFAVPASHRAMTRRIEQRRREQGQSDWYLWELRLRYDVGLVVVLAVVWLIAFLNVIEPFVEK